MKETCNCEGTVTFFITEVPVPSPHPYRPRAGLHGIIINGVIDITIDTVIAIATDHAVDRTIIDSDVVDNMFVDTIITAVVTDTLTVHDTVVDNDVVDDVIADCVSVT